MRVSPHPAQAFERLLREPRFRFSDTLIVNRVANYPGSRQVLGAPVAPPLTQSTALIEQAISLIDPAIIPPLLRGFDLRNLLDALRISGIGHALEAMRTAIRTSPMGLDVRFALADR